MIGEKTRIFYVHPDSYFEGKRHLADQKTWISSMTGST